MLKSMSLGKWILVTAALIAICAVIGSLGRQTLGTTPYRLLLGVTNGLVLAFLVLVVRWFFQLVRRR